MNDMTEQNKIVINKRHPVLKNNAGTYTLTANSYIGGTRYIDAGYLVRYYRENNQQYKDRQARAAHVNHVQPLTDMLVSYLYQAQPSRDVPAQIDYAKGTLTNIMESVAIHMMLYPVFILVDAPATNGERLTVAQRKAHKLNPYIKIYKHNEIRDFSFNENGDLEWIILDDSYIRKSIFSVDEKIHRYTIWTNTSHRVIEFTLKDDKPELISDSLEIEHDLGLLPGCFVGWDSLRSDDILQSTPFEAVGLLSKSFYNIMSCIDESLYSGSFKTMIFPVNNKDDLPAQVMNEGVGSIVVLPYPGNVSHAPAFISADADDLNNHREQLKLLTREIFRQIGLTDPEDTTKYKDSGVAKSIEFRNTAAILASYARELETAEQNIIRYFCAYESIPFTGTVTYARDYNVDDIDRELTRLYQALEITTGYTGTQQIIKKHIITKLVADLNDDDHAAILDEIQNTTPTDESV